MAGIFVVVAVAVAVAVAALAHSTSASSPSASSATLSSNGTFRGAVFQHFRTKNSSNPIGSILDNVARYEQVAATASQQGVQIIVFPEVGLGSNEVDRKLNMNFGEDVPSESEHVTPCDQMGTPYCAMRPGLCALSCMAARYGVYAVVGMNDKKACNRTSDPECPADNHYLFNTAVVFDNKGMVVARYHKKHILSPFYVFDVPAVAEVKSFKASFGVEFGVFICFDSLFRDPPLELVNLGIRHYVFPTSWTNVGPILNALPYQQAWSRAFNSTFLAANTAEIGTSGSGMYACGEIHAQFFNATLTGDADEHLLIADLPIGSCTPQPIPPAAIHKPLASAPAQDKPVTDSKACGTVGVDPCHCDITTAVPGKSGVLTATFRDLTCSASFSFSQKTPANTTERYGLIVYSGTAWFLEPLPIQLCAFVRCAREDACLIADVTDASLYMADSYLQDIHITGNFTASVEHQFVLGAARGGTVIDPEQLVLGKDFVRSTGGAWPQQMAAVSLLARLWDNTTALVP